jgi:hypothetical protein
LLRSFKVLSFSCELPPPPPPHHHHHHHHHHPPFPTTTTINNTLSHVFLLAFCWTQLTNQFPCKSVVRSLYKHYGPYVLPLWECWPSYECRQMWMCNHIKLHKIKCHASTNRSASFLWHF